MGVSGLAAPQSRRFEKNAGEDATAALGVCQSLMPADHHGPLGITAAMRTIPLLLIAALAIACSRSDGEAVGDSETGGPEQGDGDGEPEHDLDEVTLLPIGLRGITIDEYDNILHDLVGDDTRPAGRFVPDDLVRPFDNDASGGRDQHRHARGWCDGGAQRGEHRHRRALLK
jgi:hypothetical protein